MTLVSYLCSVCGHNTTELDRHVDHFKTHKPEKMLFHYPSKHGEINTRIGRYYVEFPDDLKMKMRSLILRTIDKAVEKSVEVRYLHQPN